MNNYICDVIKPNESNVSITLILRHAKIEEFSLFSIVLKIQAFEIVLQNVALLQSSRQLEVGRGDNLQLFISPLLTYEEWLYNIIDDKNFEINSLEPPCTGGLKIPRTPI